MIRQHLRRQRGITLIELLAGIIVSGIFTAIAFQMVMAVFSHQESTSSHINLRQEANIIITQVRQYHQEEAAFSFDEVVSSRMDIEFTEASDINETSPPLDRSESYRVAFTLTDNNTQRDFSFESSLQGAASGDTDSVAIERPEEEDEDEEPDENDDLREWMRSENVFIFSNTIDQSGQVDSFINNQGTIIRDGTRYEETSSSSGNTFEVRVQGSGDDQYFAPVEDSPFDVPELRDEEWYEERGYSDDDTLEDGMRLIDDDIRIAGSGNAEDVIIVAEEDDVTLVGGGEISGFLFAPNGTVTIRGNTDFTGIIAAEDVDFRGGTSITFGTYTDDTEFPF
ncbi:PulJ/GspJ family protein [Alkalicoccus chagannorensis]|uniref:PulJ/GspJ family protein n=1 Tax=Alkalicoccus chagannorensis TaxID=427072 RepID=UPI00042A22C7|nr:prepilin-type N-terminal cleavage/methylation domain-containing protein [Alkalicoccus chagannorensis]